MAKPLAAGLRYTSQFHQFERPFTRPRRFEDIAPLPGRLATCRGRPTGQSCHWGSKWHRSHGGQATIKAPFSRQSALYSSTRAIASMSKAKFPQNRDSRSASSAGSRAVFYALAAVLTFLASVTMPTPPLSFDDAASAPSMRVMATNPAIDMSKLLLLQRRADYYYRKKDLEETLDATALALDECQRQGILPDSHYALVILHNYAATLLSLGRVQECRERVEEGLGLAEHGLERLGSMGFGPEAEAERGGLGDEEWLGQKEKAGEVVEMPSEEGEVMKDERRDVFRLLIQFYVLRSSCLFEERDSEALGALEKLVDRIEEEMGEDFYRAPITPAHGKAFSKQEIASLVGSLRDAIFTTDDFARALPVARRLLRMVQIVDEASNSGASCAQMDEMRWVAIALAGAGGELARGDGGKAEQARRLYDEAREWNERSLEMGSRLSSEAMKAGHPLQDTHGQRDAETSCGLIRVLLWYHLAGLSIFVDGDIEEGKRSLRKGLAIAKALEAEGDLPDAQGYLDEIERGTLKVGEVREKYVGIFGYSAKRGRMVEDEEADDDSDGREE